MKVLVIGGTGFLGRHIVATLKKQKHRVTVMSRSPERAAAQLPDSVRVVQGDINALSRRKLTALIEPFDGLVYAAGADERTPPDTDAREFYCRENVQQCRKVLMATRDTNVSHVVLLNSIFTHLNRTHPELELSRHHPYIDSRVQQSEMALSVARDHFVVSVLEIPWVFGDSFEQTSQWAMLVNYVRGASPLVSPRGGTVAISAENVAKATAGALTRPTSSDSFPIGDCNISWDEMLLSLSEQAGRRADNVVRLPDAAFAAMMRMGGLGQTVIRAKTGLDFARMHEFLTVENYIDLATSQRLLGYGGASISGSLADTVSCVPEARVLSWWRKLANAAVAVPTPRKALWTPAS